MRGVAGRARELTVPRSFRPAAGRWAKAHPTGARLILLLAVRHPDYGAERLVFAAPAAEDILIEINLMGDRKAALRAESHVK